MKRKEFLSKCSNYGALSLLGLSGIDKYYDQEASQQKDDQEEFFSRVKRGDSKYWEKLDYDKDASKITLVGRKIQTCVCEYGQSDRPPESLCNYCCKKFQEELFELLLDRKVNVRIDGSIILGGERCSTTIFVS